MSKDTAICLALVLAFVAGFVVLMLSLPWLSTRGPQPFTLSPSPRALPHTAPARPSGHAIALTCAKKANVDMEGGLITREQVLEMERCAEQMMAILR